MAVNSNTINYDYLSSITRDKHVPKIEDNIYNSSATLKMLWFDGKIVEYTRGGTGIVEPLEYAKQGASGNYSGSDVFDVTFPDDITAARHTWGGYYASMGITGWDEAINSGENAVASLLTHRTKKATKQMKDDLGNDLFSGVGAKSIKGFETAIDDGSYGGIDGSTYSWWQSGVDETTHSEANLIDSTNTTHYILKLFRAYSKACKHKNEKPNLIVMPQTIWDIYESVLQQSARYNTDVSSARGKKMADGGFDVLEWRNIPVVSDELCPEGQVYFLNTEYMKLYLHPSRNFHFTGFKEPTNQDSRVGQVLTMCQLSVNNRRMHYKATAFPTS